MLCIDLLSYFLNKFVVVAEFIVIFVSMYSDAS